MDSPTEQGRSRLWFLGGLLGRGRTAAALTAVLIVIAGAVGGTIPPKCVVATDQIR